MLLFCVIIIAIAVPLGFKYAKLEAQNELKYNNCGTEYCDKNKTNHNLFTI